MDIMSQEVAAWQAERDRLEAKVDWQFTSGDAHQTETSLSVT